MRFTAALIASGVALIGTAIVGVPAASADCAHGGNPSATECLDGSHSDRYAGGYSEFDNIALNISAPYVNTYHVNAEQWFYTRADLAQWVEFGLRNGVDVTGTNTGYTWFWADFDAAGNEHLHTFGNASIDLAHHTYTTERASSTNHWDVFLDANYIGMSTNQPTNNGWQGFQFQVGLEDNQNQPTPVTHTSQGDWTSLQTETTSGAWGPFGYHVDWVDYPCNQYGVTPNWPNGYCFSWTPYMTEWKARKN